MIETKVARQFTLCRYPRLTYEAALAVQEAQVNKILRAEGTNRLFLLEHPPVFTVGHSGRRRDILKTEFADTTVAVACTNRGGQVTYHGPGQLIAYVVCDLRPQQHAVRNHVHRLEETVIRTLSACGLAGVREPDNPGVWVGGAKVGALGVRIRRGVAYHGIALNRDPNLKHFNGIVPCGLAGREVTSLARLGAAISRVALEEKFLVAFQAVFNVQWAAEPNDISVPANP